MSYDALTISALAIIAVLVIVVVFVGRSRAATEMKMRILAENLTMMQANEEAMAICRKIRKKYPHLCAGIDFTLKLDGDSAKIDEWYSTEPRPDL